MKLVKFLPAVAMAAVLSACSTASDIASGTVDAVKGAGSAVADGASTVGGAVVDGAKAAGGAMADGASAVGGAVVDGAKAAGSTVASGATSAKEFITGKKTVAYSCDVSGKKNQPVSATYTFKDGKPETATVTIGKKVVGKNLKLDTSYNDGVQFVSGKNIWTLYTGFSAETVKTTEPVMFTSNNNILARNCTVKK